MPTFLSMAVMGAVYLFCRTTWTFLVGHNGHTRRPVFCRGITDNLVSDECRQARKPEKYVVARIDASGDIGILSALVHS